MIDQHPSISCIIATKDRKNFVGRAIDSILRQTYPCDEILIIDDGSCDGTYQYLANKYNISNQLRLFRNHSAAGPAAARNKGILLAKGAFLTFLDDDDEWHSDKLAKQVELAKKGYEFITCTRANYSLNGRISLYGEKRDFISVEDLLRRNIVISVSPMVKRTLMNENLFNPKMKCGEDYDLWVRLLLRGVKTININEPLLTLHKTGNVSLNRSRREKIAGRVEFYNCHHKLMTFNNKFNFLLNTLCKLIVPDPRYIYKKIEHKFIKSTPINVP
jgi:glycosyltransferase involved in cell wall biosynthesis